MEKNCRTIWREAIMYYINFDENGIQAETKWFDGTTPSEDGWYMADVDIIGKRYKLSDGNAVEMTEEEILEANGQTLLETSLVGIKAERNRLLLESDWTVNPQIPMSEAKAAEWALYRQQLRDFPSTVTVEKLRSESGLSWPVRPS